MNTLGLDLSLNHTGHAYTLGGWQVAVHTHDISEKEVKAGMRGLRRLAHLDEWFAHEIEGVDPDLVVIEDYAFSRGGKTFEIAEWGGAVRLRLWYKRIRTLTASIQALKMFASGKGNTDKNLVVRDVFKRWGYEAPDDNCSDAFVLAMMGEAYKNRAYYEQRWGALTQPQLRALSSMKEIVPCGTVPVSTRRRTISKDVA